jgi:outer membrane receptor for ferrienterochelin and colicins
MPPSMKSHKTHTPKGLLSRFYKGQYLGKCPFMLGIFFLLSAGHYVFAQRVQLLAESDQGSKPMQDAVVLFKSMEQSTFGQNRVVFAEADGSVQFPFKGRQLIQVSYLGYQTLTDTLNSDHPPAKLELKRNDVVMGEQVITGQSTSDFATNAVERIRVIDRTRIETQGAVNLRDLLSNELNVRITQDNILGSGMEIQGMSGQNVKILLDGVPLIGRMNGQLDLSQINLSNIERIEIVEGPMSAAYGTDALGGVIHLISRKPKKQIEAGVNSYYETIGHYNIDARVGLAIRKHQFAVSGGRYFFDGWDPQTNFNRAQLWKPKEQYFGDLTYSITSGPVRVRYQGTAFYETVFNRGAPVVTPYQAIARDEYYRTLRSTHNLSLNTTFKKGRTLDLIFAYSLYNRRRNTYQRDMTTLNDQLTTNKGDQDTILMHNAVMRGVYNHIREGKRVSFQAGYDFNLDFALGGRLTGGLKTMQEYSFFGTVDINPIKGLNIRPAIRYGYHTAYTLPFIGSLALKYTINEEFTIRASYARGFRTPTLKELYLFFVDINHNIRGNENLKPEDSHNTNVSFTWQRAKDKWSLRLEQTVFYNYLTNQIQLALVRPESLLYTYINIGRYQTVGFQTTQRFRYKGLSVDVGLVVTGRYNVAREQNNALPSMLFSPEVRTQLSYTFKKINLTLAGFYKYNGRIPGFLVVSGETKQTTIGDYHLLDATVTKGFWKNRIQISVGAKNLLNVRNVQASAVSTVHSGGGSMAIGTGVSGFVSFRLNFSSN